MFNVDLFKKHLKTKIIGKKTFYYESTKSTNYDIWELFKKERKEGIAVIANEQFEGRGRNEKVWHSKKDKSIICSFLIKQKFSTEKMGLHAILVPVGIILGINKTINNKFSIKWPNDIYVNKKKICGILIETKNNMNSAYLNIGFGINVNENNSDLHFKIKNRTTSIKIISGNETKREVLLANILNSIDELLFNKNESEILEYWMQFCNHINQEIFCKYKNKLVKGIFKKINEKGNAIIEYNNKDFIFDGPILNI